VSARGRTVVALGSLAVLLAVVTVAWLSLRHVPDAQDGVTGFVCPMHPQVAQERPGKCPICGMDLVPAPERPAHAGQAGPAEPVAVAGLARVRLTDEKARRIGARSVPAVSARFERIVRAVGDVAVDETRLRRVHTKTAGWVERLWANAAGAPVRQGAPLLEIYSPELLAAQEEFLVALRAQGSLASSSMPEVARSADSLVRAARRRLALLDMGGDDIAALESSGRARRTVVVESPISGTVLFRGIAQGARVEPGTLLLEVADLSRVWVLASVFEYELPFVREGQAATLTLPYLPGREFHGTVTQVYPTLDPATRAAQVRVEVANPEGTLRPGMFAEALLVADLGERLSVPTEAVMETGTRSVVYVDEGDGVFSPRVIEIGSRLAGRVEVLAGLAAGERVLAQGNFFVDSESKLHAGLEAAAQSAAQPRP
jgi:Cu(I)/Ag(I) efflux system membrane fusion protein